MTSHGAEEDGVDDAVGRHPITVTGYDDDRQEHQSEAVYKELADR